MTEISYFWIAVNFHSHYLTRFCFDGEHAIQKNKNVFINVIMIETSSGTLN